MLETSAGPLEIESAPRAHFFAHMGRRDLAHDQRPARKPFSFDLVLRDAAFSVSFDECSTHRWIFPVVASDSHNLNFELVHECREAGLEIEVKDCALEAMHPQLAEDLLVVEYRDREKPSSIDCTLRSAFCRRSMSVRRLTVSSAFWSPSCACARTRVFSFFP